MSLPARTACDGEGSPEPYLQSPLDDLESFFWVALWAALHNKSCTTPTKEEKKWRDSMRRATLERNAVAHEMGNGRLAHKVPKFNPVLRYMWNIFPDWLKELDTLWGNWDSLQTQDQDNETKVLQFDFYAYSGVKAFLDVLIRHRERIENEASNGQPVEDLDSDGLLLVAK